MHKKGQDRPESPTVIVIWPVSKYKINKCHQRYILSKGCPPPPNRWHVHIPQFQQHSETQVCKSKTESVFFFLFYSRQDLVSGSTQHTNTYCIHIYMLASKWNVVTSCSYYDYTVPRTKDRSLYFWIKGSHQVKISPHSAPWQALKSVQKYRKISKWREKVKRDNWNLHAIELLSFHSSMELVFSFSFLP